ncbi:MAG: nitronate monooxygenase [Bdellovibrionota bacterium]
MKDSDSFCKQLGIQYPIICGPMYPCSNPELVAAASEAGGVGVVQPLSLVFVHKYDFRKGLQYIKSMTDKPIGMNVIVEKSSKTYEKRMQEWVDIALEEGIRFFVTSLGNPGWVVDAAHSAGGVVYHDVVNAKWAHKACEKDVDGLICVNNRAGGHAGDESSRQLLHSLSSFDLPLVCAGGIGSMAEYQEALALGYAGVQLGTRFIASTECNAHRDYKNAILQASARDIVLTDKISGVPVSVIKTPYIEKTGTKAGFLARKLLKGRKTKHWMRLYYTVKSLFQLRSANLKGTSYRDFYQAGKSVQGIHEILPVKDIINSLVSQ